MNICFLDHTTFEYDPSDIYHPKLRGAETTLINLSTALSLLGHKITVINNCKNEFRVNNIHWKNINLYSKKDIFDITFSNGDCRLFDLVNSRKKILFSHSLQSIEKFIRKKQLLAFFKHRPIVAYLGKYHLKYRSKLLNLFGILKVEYAVDKIFLNAKIDDNIDNNLAIFTSRPDRNLSELTNIWINKIYPKNSNLKLSITESSFKNEYNIINRKFSSQNDLVYALLKSRVCLIPGHKAELFCLAAEEAKELCIPIVTLGKGCLSERVEHEKTGFIARNADEFADFTIELFRNDNLWKQIRETLKNRRGKLNWKIVANNLLNQIN